VSGERRLEPIEGVVPAGLVQRVAGLGREQALVENEVRPGGHWRERQCHERLAIVGVGLFPLERVREAVRRLTGTGATVLVFTGFDTAGRLPLGARLALRTATYNELVRRAVAEFEAVLVDMWDMAILRDDRMWGEDRLHLGDEGHRRVAGAVLEALGRDPGFDWRAPPPGSGTAHRTWSSARRDDARWARGHVVPWVARHVKGESTGDHVSPKRPTLQSYPA